MYTPSSTSPTFTPSNPFSSSSTTSLTSDSPEKSYPGRLPDSGILQGSTTSNTIDYLTGFKKPEKIIRIMEMMLDNLEDSYKQIENPAYKNQLEKCYEEIKNMLKESSDLVQTATRVKEIEKANYVENLRNYENRCKHILADFKTKKIDYNKALEEFNKFNKQHCALLDKVLKKIDKSNNKNTTLQIISNKDALSKTMRKAYTHALDSSLGSNITTTILNNFIQNAEKHENNYPQLIQAYVNSLYQFRLLRDELQLGRYIDDIITPLAWTHEKLKNQNKNFNQIRGELKLICPQYNAEHNYDLKTFLTNIVQYTKTYISFYDQDIKVIEINELKNQYLKEAERITDDITGKINNIKTRYNGILRFYDEDTQDMLLEQNENAIKHLITLQKDIINKWNDFTLDLYELNNQRAIFDSIEPIDKKIGWSYVLTKSIKDRLFKKLTRIKDDTEKTKVFNELKTEYINLCKFIKYSDSQYGLKKGTPDYESMIENILEVDEDQIDPFVIFDILPSYNPNKTDCDKTLLNLISDFSKIPDDKYKAPYGAVSNGWLVLDNSTNVVEQEIDKEKRAKEIGVVWNDETKKAVLERCEQKKMEYHKMLTKKKAKCCKAYSETLSEVCNSTALFINVMGKELIELKHYKQSDSKAKNEKSLTKQLSTPTEEIESFEEVKSPFHDDFDPSKL